MYKLTPDEVGGVAAIRDRIPDIPPDLNTDLNLRRWHIGWKGNVDSIVPRLSSYIRNRRAAGYDGADFVQRLPEIPAVKDNLQFYSISRFLEPVVDPSSNSVLFIQRTEGVFHDDIIKTIKTSDILLLYFAFCELTLRHILAQEAATGRPSAMTMILDMQHIPLNDFVVPTSPANVLMRLCMSIFQDWYCEFLHKAVVVNPPTVVNVLWTIGKAFISENTLNKIVITSKYSELPSHLDACATPQAYGGTFRDLGGHGIPELGTPTPTPIRAEHHYHPGHMWAALGLPSSPPREREWVKPGKTLRLERGLEAGQALAWLFSINGEMSFCVLRLRADGAEESVFPELGLATLTLPEEGVLRAPVAATYVLQFRNTSSYVFAIKLDIALAVK